MVYRCEVVVGWPKESGRQPMVYNFLLPPIVVPSTSAAAMYQALRGHPSYLKFQRALYILRAHAHIRGFLLESDAAYGNEKLVAHIMRQMPCGAHLCAWKTCHSHRNMHVETSVVSAVDARLLGQLYSLCAFVKTASHFYRLRQAVATWTRKTLAAGRGVVLGIPSVVSSRLATCIIDYFSDAQINRLRTSQRRDAKFEHVIGNAKRARTSDADMYKQKLCDFLKGTYNCLDNTGVFHCCRGAECCPNGLASLQERMTEGFASLVINRTSARFGSV